VAKPGLGTINHTLLTIRQAKVSRINVLGVIISNYDDANAGIAEMTAPEVIERIGKVPVLGIVSHIEGAETEKGFKALVKEVEERVRFDLIC
ncbi:MAG: dethiobiotin synthase, partial [Deltaproteobacteria bacterium]|nr:dethiobiotin synthase [Deltaproteobacteria bacterium]